jgi:hypothetical protein
VPRAACSAAQGPTSQALEEHGIADTLVVATVGTRDLDHAPAVTLEAVHVVGVDAVTVAEQGDDSEAGQHRVTRRVHSRGQVRLPLVS